MSECRHATIVTWGTPDNRLWACAVCSRRFYPACETCVSVGHRNETHAPEFDPDTIWLGGELLGINGVTFSEPMVPVASVRAALRAALREAE